MRRAESDALYTYLIKRLDELEGNLIDAQNHMRFRRIDDVDCLEYIIALARLRAFTEFSGDLAVILKLVDISEMEDGGKENG